MVLSNSECEKTNKYEGLFNSVPIDIIYVILLFCDIKDLLSFRRVNSIWKKIISSPKAWQYIILEPFSTLITDQNIQEFSNSFFNNILVLNINDCTKISEKYLGNFLIKYCPNLIYFSAKNCNVSDNLSKYLMSCPSLTYANLSGCGMITDLFAQNLYNCKHLLHFYIDMSHSVHGRFISYQTPQYLSLHHPNIESLNMKGCSRSTDQSVFYIHLCHSLHYLDLSYCRNITNESCVLLSQGCVQLNHLELEGCYLIDDIGLSHFSTLKHLQYLNLSCLASISDITILIISQNCRQLQSIYLNFCPQITDKTAQYLFNGCPELLSIFLSHCHLLSDITIAYLSQCQLLKTIDISGTQITDKSPLFLQNGKCRDSLSTLIFSDCIELSDQSILLLSQCHNLKYLNMSGCFHVYYSSIYHILPHCIFIPPGNASDFFDDLSSYCLNQMSRPARFTSDESSYEFKKLTL